MFVVTVAAGVVAYLSNINLSRHKKFCNSNALQIAAGFFLVMRKIFQYNTPRGILRFVRSLKGGDRSGYGFHRDGRSKCGRVLHLQVA